MSDRDLRDEELQAVGPVLQRLMWADRVTRAKSQQWGVNVVPINFYSNVPSLKEIEDSYEYQEGAVPYLNDDLFDAGFLEEFLRSELLPFAAEFDPPVDGDEESCDRYFWNNSQFSHSDAMSYYCFVRALQPRAVLEIGAGFSTLVASEAIMANRKGALHCVEPNPRTFLESRDDIVLYRRPAQELTADFMNEILSDGDILFIDSTHTVKSGSDCLHIYLRLLPQLRRKVSVHVHDVFLPFGLPKEWLADRQIFWTEQYLLMAFLLGNTKARVLFGSTYNATFLSEAMDELMSGKARAGGGSFWFEYDGRR